MDDETFEDYHIPFQEHVAEIFRRVLTVTFFSLCSGLVGYLLSTKLVALLGAALGWWTAISPTNLELSFGKKVLWAAIIVLVTFHLQLVSNTYRFIAPGLYPRERRMFLIPLIWSWLTPIVTLGFLIIYYLTVTRLNYSSAVDLDSVRSAMVRFYLITALGTILLIPMKSKRSLRIGGYLGFLMVVWLLPDHFFDSLAMALTGVCLLVLTVDAILLSIWKDDDVNDFFDEEKWKAT